MKEVGGEGESSVLRQVDRLGYFFVAYVNIFLCAIVL